MPQIMSLTRLSTNVNKLYKRGEKKNAQVHDLLTDLN